MPYSAFGRTLRKVGVIGSGQIGPDIALFFSKVLHRDGVPVVVVDVVQQALDHGKARTEKKVGKGVESGAFKPDEARAMLENIAWTSDYAQLEGADLVIEAATENLDIKRKIFAELERRCPPDAILASNSSHLEPEVIAAGATRPDRVLVIHYFFPAERNPLVEVVPGSNTHPSVADFCMSFYESIGKVPIRVRSRYGYAIDPIFEGLFQGAALCVEEGLGSPKVVDAIAVKALGLGVGPFTAMNLTGGNPLTRHGLDQYTKKINAWFRPPRILDEQIAKNQPWEAAGKGEQVAYTQEQYDRVSNALLGVYFGLATEVLESGITNLGDLEMAVELGLAMSPPFALMNQIGVAKALDLVRAYKKTHPDFVVPRVLSDQGATGKPWRVPFVFREDKGDVALVTIKRPRVLNALNQEVFAQIQETFTKIGQDRTIRAAVLTGFGTKAFVSGADVGMLATIDSPARAEEMSWGSHQVLLSIENLGKPVVCAMNGLAFGGGSELALACTTRIARKGLAPLAAQPEVRLGIICGAGGTQRLPRTIGFERAWELLRTGRPFSSAEALSMGYLHAEVEGDLVGEAVRLARLVAQGKTQVRTMPKGPYEVPAKPPEVDLGPLSRRIDEINRKAILEGAKLPLEEGLRLEARCFGECATTRDMRIGIENFVKNGPRANAPFVHA